MIRIGVFDSGVGGLSVLRALVREIPGAQFIYFADSGYAPYGDKGDAYVTHRSELITDLLLHEHQIDLLVIACNTATAAAAAQIRSQHPQLPIVGIEPALKPAALQSQHKRIGVMATSGTVGSSRFQNLQKQVETLHPEVQFQILACEGLAKAIESSFLSGQSQECEAIAIHFAAQFQDIDTLVLGCTHYPFVQTALQNYFNTHANRHVTIMEPSTAVALQAKRLINHLRPAQSNPLKLENRACTLPTVTLLSSGDKRLLDAAYKSLVAINTDKYGV